MQFRKQNLLEFCYKSKQKFLEPNGKDNWNFFKNRIVIPYYPQVQKTPWLCLNTLLQDLNNWQTPTLLQRLNSGVLLCHSITNHQQITFTTLSMQTYQQRLGGSLPVAWQQTSGGGIRVVHQSSKLILRTQQTKLSICLILGILS